ncbi:MAG: ABC transporter ATP-binding protein [Myxococcota bacterium]
MDPVLSINGLSKTYAGGHTALRNVDLEVKSGEIFALLGPNGAGKTTLISIVCGIVTPSTGSIQVGGHDHAANFRAARSLIGLVPQELHTDAFEPVMGTVRFSRGLFGKPRDDAFLEKLLKDLSLWEKRDAKIMALSGGMKRRVMIAKALSHEPSVLFLDEPSAGVDVELRRNMWSMVRSLRDRGVTIILTTHYIQEAEEMADRVGVINQGQLVLVEETSTLMQKLGKKTLTLELASPLERVPTELADWNLSLDEPHRSLTYYFDARSERTGVSELLRRLDDLGIAFTDLQTRQSSLEEIFVDLVATEEPE